MKAEIKYLHSPDVLNLETFTPIIPDSFGFLLQMMVGEKNKEGEESFDIMVCTPKWLIENQKKSDIILGLHYLIIFEYNYSRLYNKLKSIVDNVNGETWADIGSKLGVIGKWEFQDYTTH